MDDIIMDDGFEGNSLLRELCGGIQNLDIDNMDDVRFSIISFQTNYDLLSSLKFWVLDASFNVSVKSDWLDLIKQDMQLPAITDDDDSIQPLVSLKNPKPKPPTPSLVNPKQDDSVKDAGTQNSEN